MRYPWKSLTWAQLLVPGMAGCDGVRVCLPCGDYSLYSGPVWVQKIRRSQEGLMFAS